MTRFLRLLGGLTLSFLLPTCSKTTHPASSLPFESIPTANLLQPQIVEISGLTDSKANPGMLWVHEDSGRPTSISLVRHNGGVQKTIFLSNVTNRDWEDMAIAGNRLFIAETGDNSQVYSHYSVYRFTEPGASVDTVQLVDRIQFQYPDGSHDCEAILVDPATEDIFLITKRDSQSRIYKLSFPYSTTAMNMASYEGSLPYTGVVGAALNETGSEILVKTYDAIYFYRKKPGQNIAQALATASTKLGYQQEPQGEAIGFARDNSGFFTLSESVFGSAVQVYFYRRK